ncbi:helix-turn-helix transcriptional regulator [Clostridium sp. ASF356]|nr:helix-turn-helix transcriptional regulator [Clostridium sp. MD294]
MLGVKILKKSYLYNSMIERIKQKRKEKGYTQEKMAELLNISYSNYSKIENAIVTPTLERLIDISQILEVSLDYLVYGQQNNDEVKYYSSNRQKEAIVSLIKNCDKENLQYIIHFLEKIYSLL